MVNAFLHYIVKYKSKGKLTIMLQTNIAINDLYDTRLCYTHRV